MAALRKSMLTNPLNDIDEEWDVCSTHRPAHTKCKGYWYWWAWWAWQAQDKEKRAFYSTIINKNMIMMKENVGFNSIMVMMML